MTLRDDLAALLPRLGEADLPKFCAFHEKYAPHLNQIGADLYDRLDAPDQARFLVWFLKRWAKIDRVNPVERALQNRVIERVKAEPRVAEALGGTTYQVLDFKSQGQDFELLGYDWVLGVHDVYYNQYEHGEVRLDAGDVIIDAGAFIGDTAVHFHHKLGGQCALHCFELLDENLALLQHNLERNGVPDDGVVLNKMALSDTTGQEILVSGARVQSATSMFGGRTAGERVQTVTLDDYVVALGLERVDFLKMDIEGAETLALRGAQHTIRHFQPKLAICLYHRWDDVVHVPRLIHATGVDYRFSFKWVELTEGWEAVLLAMPVSRSKAVSAPLPVSPAPGLAVAEDALASAMNVLTKAYNDKCSELAALRRAQAPVRAPACAPAPVLEPVQV